ncbi:unnamed protein product [Prunus armeniaca]|uniref:Uncharacterized protein n=1 Tax=Prunus armeniaca TaxID=36596 RepID=A0A6J5WDS3_PRUAR|nr:unnamed protein product [Prunus armeniaca]
MGLQAKQSKAITLDIDLIQIGKRTKTLLLQQAKIRHSQPKSVKGHAAEGKGDHPCLECQSKRMGACRPKQMSVIITSDTPYPLLCLFLLCWGFQTLREKRGYSMSNARKRGRALGVVLAPQNGTIHKI